jgi:hypothetical protein
MVPPLHKQQPLSTCLGGNLSQDYVPLKFDQLIQVVNKKLGEFRTKLDLRRHRLRCSGDKVMTKFPSIIVILILFVLVIIYYNC